MIDTTGSLLSRQVRRKIERQKNKNATLTVKPEYLKDLCSQAVKQEAEKFAEMCLELYDTVEKGFVTPAELRQCLFEEAGVRFKRPSDSLTSEGKEATKV